MSPSALHNIWIRNRERRQLDNNYLYELRNDNDFYIPYSQTDFISRLPLHHLPTLWNSLPPDLQIICNKYEFNFKLKNYLIDLLSETPICNRLLCPNCHLYNLINTQT